MMSNDDVKGCRDIDVFTKEAMADRGINISAAFFCEVRRYDGVAMDIHVKTYADLKTFLDELNAERVLVFRGADEDREEFNFVMKEIAQQGAVLH